MKPLESSEIEVADETNKKRAIAYYRSSSEHQEKGKEKTGTAMEIRCACPLS